MDLSTLSDSELLDLKAKTKAKIVKYKIIQATRKVQLNSAYGACGNAYFRFSDVRLAESITLCGQYVIQKLESEMNKFLSSRFGQKNYVIASDTDSLYLFLGDFVRGIKTDSEIDKVNAVDKFCKEIIQPEINKVCEKIHSYLHCFKNKLHMKRENIANRAVWTGKKRYILNVWDSEGVRYSEPKLKVVGISSVSSSTPQVCREKIKKTISIIMNGTESEVIDLIDDFKKEFWTLPVEEVATPKGMNNLAKYYSSSGGFRPKAPVQVKAALIYNSLLDKLGLTKSYQYIPEGTKGKFTYLLTPNPIGHKVIGFPHVLPKEFDLGGFVDYEKQFENGYLRSVKRILDVIGWKSEKTYDISFMLDYEDEEENSSATP